MALLRVFHSLVPSCFDAVCFGEGCHGLALSLLAFCDIVCVSGGGRRFVWSVRSVVGSLYSEEEEAV